MDIGSKGTIHSSPLTDRDIIGRVSAYVSLDFMAAIRRLINHNLWWIARLLKSPPGPPPTTHNRLGDYRIYLIAYLDIRLLIISLGGKRE